MLCVRQCVKMWEVQNESGSIIPIQYSSEDQELEGSWRVPGSIFDLAYHFGTSKLLYCILLFFYIIGILEIREIAYNLIPQNLIIHGTIIIPNSLPLLSLYQFQNWDHNIYVLLYIDFCLFVLLSISILFLFSIITDFKNIVVKKNLSYY